MRRLRAKYAVALLLMGLMSFISFPVMAEVPKATGGLEGEVLYQGKAVAGASIGVFYSSVDGPVHAGEAGRAITDAEGRFAVAGLRAAPYIVCLRAAADELLDPCEWSLTPPLARVKAGETTRGLKITLDRGVKFKIRLEDPDKVIATRSNQRADTSLVLGVWSKQGFFHPARLVSSDDTGLDYELLLPPGADHNLKFEGNNVDVADSHGASLGPAPTVTLKGNAGQPVQSFAYRVSAKSGGN